MNAKLTIASRIVAITAALALFVDLFLSWREAPVHSQWLSESGGASGLNGWGVLVPPMLVGFLFVEIFLRKPRLALAFAGGAAVFTAVEFATGAASVVRIGGVAQAATEATLWPAFAGLILAFVLVAASFARLFERPRPVLPMPPLPATTLLRRTAAER